MIESIKPIYRGRVLELNLETVRLPNDRTAELEIIHHPGGAAIVALDTMQRVCLLRQYRHAAAGWLWELPAGKIDHHEPPIETARRELAEEGGVQAERWVSLGDYVSSPGVFTEVVHLFMATNLTAVAAQPEEHEVFEVEWRAFKDVLAMANAGELRDGKSLVGIYRAAAHLAGSTSP